MKKLIMFSLFVFGFSVLSFGQVDLTHGGKGYWRIFDSEESEQTSWDDSELFFTSQAPNGDIFDLTAYYIWYPNNLISGDITYWGAEYFTGI